MAIALTIFIYFSILFFVSKITARRATNATFFSANKRSPWYMVAFGMIGASISGVTFVSVPGMVNHISMTYLQTCLGFVVGYFVVAFVLLPIYYKLNLTTIYTYLLQRLGNSAYKTGAWFFLLSKMAGSVVRFYVVCIILQRFVLDAFGVPFVVTVGIMAFLIWLYTYGGGIKTLVFTDVFQTFCMFAALILIIYNVIDALHLTIPQAITTVINDSRSAVFEFENIRSTQWFWKQFVSGAFIVIVMTGLDQDMMQKNLTCKTLKEAQKDMCTYGFAFIPANLLFLFLGVLLSLLAAQKGLSLPAKPDELLPMFAATGVLGNVVVVLFTIGIVAASFSSADSALTALTTTFCIDVCRKPQDERFRKRVHIVMTFVFGVCIALFQLINATSVIDAIYTLCAYTYGPLLGLFAFSLFTRYGVKNKVVPFIAILSPVACGTIEWLCSYYLDYKVGYELLLLNGVLTFAGLYAFKTTNANLCNQKH